MYILYYQIFKKENTMETIFQESKVLLEWENQVQVRSDAGLPRGLVVLDVLDMI